MANQALRGKRIRLGEGTLKRKWGETGSHSHSEDRRDLSVFLWAGNPFL
jgi:hypothetical protein